MTETPPDLIWSDPCTAIAEAFVTASKSVAAMVKDEQNPHFKSRFASINAAYAAVKPALAEQDCSISHAVSPGDDGWLFVVTRVTHKDGEWVRTPGFPMPAPKDPQKIGSAVTYGKRYDLVAMFALETADDDGNDATAAVLRDMDEARELEARIARVHDKIGKLDDDGKAELRAWNTDGHGFSGEALANDLDWLAAVEAHLAGTEQT